MIPVLSWDFYLYGNSREKVNISWVTAVWAPHTVGGRPQSDPHTGAGTCAGTGGGKNFPRPWPSPGQQI